MTYPQKFAKTKDLPGDDIDLKKLDKKLDRIMSFYIRIRDIVHNESGISYCITCGRPHHWKQMHMGHFVTRDRLAVKFNEDNLNGQCNHCNTYKKGDQAAHGFAIDRKYGKPGLALSLLAMGAKKVKLSRMWYENEIKIYKQKLKDIKIEKGVS